MRVSRKAIAAAALIGAAGCGTDPVGPKTEYGGVKYTAAVNTIQSGMSLTQFAVLVTLENMTTATVTRTYPAGCPVRIRLYRDSDGKRVYDETLRTCAFTNPATLQLTSRATFTLTSGPRLPGTVLGDSLPVATYIVHAVVQTEGTTVVEIAAGSYLIGTGPGG
jgi:hypothetical protein